MRVLGIETSCDETGVAVIESVGDLGAKILGEALFSQAPRHRPYGGVVPELAARDHIVRLTPMLDRALGDLPPDAVDAVAYTAGPGLIGPLMTGAMFAHGLAMALGRPALGIHHMEAHLLSPRIGASAPRFPFVALLVSGGHTLLYRVGALGRYELLGQTLDDAAGEAFDKTARLLGLDYPGGPAIAKLAAGGRPGRYTLPRPMLKQKTLDFSFSGLKTHAATLFRDRKITGERERADFALEFEEAVTDALAVKCRRALERTHTKTLVVAGGVSANRRLRDKLNALTDDGVAVHFPEQSLCTDNGVMVAYAGLVRLAHGCAPDKHPEAKPRWALTDLPAMTRASLPA